MVVCCNRKGLGLNPSFRPGFSSPICQARTRLCLPGPRAAQAGREERASPPSTWGLSPLPSWPRRPPRHQSRSAGPWPGTIWIRGASAARPSATRFLLASGVAPREARRRPPRQTAAVPPTPSTTSWRVPRGSPRTLLTTRSAACPSSGTRSVRAGFPLQPLPGGDTIPAAVAWPRARPPLGASLLQIAGRRPPRLRLDPPFPCLNFGLQVWPRRSGYIRHLP